LRNRDSFAGLLEGQPMLALGVALLAARHQISFGGFSAPDDRHQMIHRQIAGRKSLAAMVAETRRPFALPPLAGAQLARSAPLTPNDFLGDFDQERFRFHRHNRLICTSV
jgi:hypothetical protein